MTRAQFEENLAGKRARPDFRDEVPPLLRPGLSWSFDAAMDTVLEDLVASLLPRPLHSRFALKERLDFYSTGDLEEIVRKEGEKVKTRVSRKAARILAGGSRGTPRNLLSNLGRARDLARIESGQPGEVFIDAEIARRALESQGIDTSGLDRMDRRIVQVLLERGRPTGLRTLADQLGEDRKTIAEIHEPYLLRKGLFAGIHLPS